MSDKIMTREQIVRKEYVYQLGGIELRFTLRQDIKAELTAFKECMERAMVDINADLEAMK